MTRWALVLLLAAGCRERLTASVDAPGAREAARAWEAALTEVVRADGTVDYRALAERREALDGYVAWLGEPRTPARSAPRHAFYLNAFNALVLFQVLERGVPTSVRDVPGWLPGDASGFFYETEFLVDGRGTSLHELRDELLRFKVLDFRDHAALVDGTASSPPLRPTLYTPEGLDKQLKAQMTRWVDGGAVTVDGAEAVFHPRFETYAYDFSFQTAGDDLCTIAARFATGDRREGLRRLAAHGCPHRFASVDWRLNDAE